MGHQGRHAFPSVPAAGWRVVTEIVAPHLEADVAVRIAPTVRPYAWEEADGIRIPGARSRTAKAILPVRRFGSDMDRRPRDVDMMSRGTRSVSDLPLGCVCARRAQRVHRSNCPDQPCFVERSRSAGVGSHRSEPKSQKSVHELAPLPLCLNLDGSRATLHEASQPADPIELRQESLAGRLQR